MKRPVLAGIAKTQPMSMSKSLGTLPKLPRTLVDDPEEVSWALDIARGLAKGKDFQAALVWLRRAAQSAAMAESDDRAVELAEAAKLLGGWIRSADLEPDSKGRKKRTESLLPRRRSSTRTRRIVGLRVGIPPSLPSVSPSKPPPSQRKGAPSTTTTQIMQVSKQRLPVAPAKPAAKSKSAAPPPIPKSPAKAKSIAPPPAKTKSIAPPKLPKAKSAPPAAVKKSVRPPPKSVKPAKIKTEPPVSVRKSMRPAQRTLLFSDVLPTANDPDDALVNDSIRAIPSFAKLSKGKKLALSHSAEIMRPSSGDEVNVTGLLYVAHGEVQVSAAVSDIAPVTLERGAALRGQSSVGVPLALRCIAIDEGVVLLRWTVGELAEALVDSRATDDELRELADPIQAACGAALGDFAEGIGEETLRVLLQRMQLKRLKPGEIFVEKGEPLPGVCVLGLGELRAEELRNYGPGDVPFAESALACEPLELTLTAGAKGALLWVGTRAALFELLTSAPTLLESLTQS